ncbi:NAD(P)H-dependent glycerol-3-phosphate dehydrogenase [Truepera radiovictrix]|nr:NAD(P)H-dependent glycerol-3-phosphate dehydrogenase [Truepera radiovictrix]WMT57722.1 NAD(P)H-dependent glycerol-3-phosphate dehydrogenase [Truepera radiovictrix]
MSAHHDASTPPTRVAVLGAGAWGTVVARLLTHHVGLRVRLWARRPEAAEAMARLRENAPYVPGLRLPESLHVTSDLAEAVRGAEAVFVAVPSRGLREVMARLKALGGSSALVSCAKGLELGTFKRFSEVMAEYLPEAPLAALSGPNLALEIARGLPASATVASLEGALALRVQGWLNQPTFRVYTSGDLIGVEMGGALKNVVALAAGMSDGLGLGDNAKASLITRGLAEIVRLGVHMGGEEKTFYGLSGLGDLVATCSSRGSRNHLAGERLARGETLQDLEASRLTAEGIPTVRAVVVYAQEVGLELPIARAVYDVIYEGKAPQRVLGELMARGAKPEH